MNRNGCTLLKQALSSPSTQSKGIRFTRSKAVTHPRHRLKMEGRETPSQSEATGGRKNEIDAPIDFMYWTAMLPTKIQTHVLTPYSRTFARVGL